MNESSALPSLLGEPEEERVAPLGHEASPSAAGALRPAQEVDDEPNDRNEPKPKERENHQPVPVHTDRQRLPPLSFFRVSVSIETSGLNLANGTARGVWGHTRAVLLTDLAIRQERRAFHFQAGPHLSGFFREELAG